MGGWFKPERLCKLHTCQQVVNHVTECEGGGLHRQYHGGCCPLPHWTAGQEIGGPVGADSASEGTGAGDADASEVRAGRGT